MNSKVLNGSQRVVMDGLISDDECRELQRLTNVREAGWRPLLTHSPPTHLISGHPGPLPLNFGILQAAATSGDGYRGQTSPHTPNEKFYGVTVFKALKVEWVQVGSACLRSSRREKLLALDEGKPGAHACPHQFPACGE